MFCVGSVDESSSAWSENSWIPTACLPTWVEYGRRVRCPPRVVLVDVLRAVAFCANVVSSEPRIANGWFFTQTADVDLRSCVHSGAGGATDGATLREPEASLPAKRRGGAVCAEAATAFAVRTVAFFLNNVMRGCALGVCFADITCCCCCSLREVGRIIITVYKQPHGYICVVWKSKNIEIL